MVDSAHPEISRSAAIRVPGDFVLRLI